MNTEQLQTVSRSLVYVASGLYATAIVIVVIGVFGFAEPSDALITLVLSVGLGIASVIIGELAWRRRKWPN